MIDKQYEAYQTIINYWVDKMLDVKTPKEFWLLLARYEDAMERSLLRLDWDMSTVNHCNAHTAIVTRQGEYTCTCPDNQYRNTPCKHLFVLACNSVLIHDEILTVEHML